MIATSPFVYTVGSKVPVSTLKDFIDLAKSKPGGLRYGSAGTGSVLHLVGEMLKVDAGIDVIHVPYRGGAPIVQDLMANQIEMGVIGPVDVSSRMDTLKPLAQTGGTRHASIPSVPTTAEAGSPNLNISTMFILVGPAGMPQEIVDRLNKAITAVAGSADFRRRMEAVGSEINVLTGPALVKHLADDLKRWKDVAQSAGISLDQ
jgi:tripartite-type tricarboxylate transporter receptor subunit TctC